MSQPSEGLLQDTNEINTIIKSILTRMQNDCKVSKNFLDSNIEDSMAKTIRKWIESPLESSMKSFRSAENTALIMIENLIEFVFNNLYKDIIYKVYKDTNNYKDYDQYVVILKEDTIENRGLINYFIFLYNRSDLRKRFPLIIQFIPKEFENELINVKELSLSND